MESRGPLRALLIPGIAMEAGFLGLLLAAPAPGRLAPFFLLFFAVFVLYALSVRTALRPSSIEGCRAGGAATGAVLVLACLYRATLLFGPPTLSNDIHRYLWDGRVVLSGGNPYLDPPASPRLARLRDESYQRIDHQTVRTIYPPLAQVVFAAGAALAPGVLGLKVLLVLADLLGIAVLRRILELRGLPPLRILIYAWNPLAVIEGAWSGHIEPAGILCVLFGAAAIIQKRDLRSTVALSLGGLVKLLPFALFLPLLRSIRLRLTLLVPLLAAAAYWPFRAAGHHILDGLVEYADRWLANESLFGILHAGIAWIDPTPTLKSTIAFLRSRIPGIEPLDLLYPYLYPRDLAKATCLLASLGCALELVRRRVDPLRGCYLLTGLVLLLSPTLHPWYLLWILPWLCLFPSRPWILLSGLVTLAYAEPGMQAHGDAPYPWLRLLEYVPFYALLISEWLGGRRRAPLGETLVDPSLPG